MVKSVTANALDRALDYIAARADLMTLCAGAPTTSGEAVALVSQGGKALASIVLTEGTSGGIFSVTDGIFSGRRINVAAQAAVPISEAGTIDHIALVDTDNSELLVVTPLTEEQVVTSGAIISVKAFGSEIAAPA